MKFFMNSLLVLAFFGLLAGCNIFLDGEKQEGTPCDSDINCADGYQCITVVDGTEDWGECSSDGQQGHACYKDEFCAEGLVCNEFYECVEEPECEKVCGDSEKCEKVTGGDQICVPFGEGHVGQPCFLFGDDEVCAFDAGGNALDCIHPSDATYIPDSLCVPEDQGRATDDCFPREQGSGLCNDPLFCIGGSCETDPMINCSPDPDNCDEGESCEEIESDVFVCIPEGFGQIDQECYSDGITLMDVCAYDSVCISPENLAIHICVPPEYGGDQLLCYQSLTYGSDLCDFGMECIGDGCEYPPNPCDACDPPNVCIEVPGDSESEWVCALGSEGQFDMVCLGDGRCQIGSHCMVPHTDPSFPWDDICLEDEIGIMGSPCHSITINETVYDICDDGLGCDGNCEPHGEEGSYCDADEGEYPCDTGLHCVHFSQNEACVPEDQGLLGQRCYLNPNEVGDCEDTTYCMPLDDGNICALDNHGGLDEPCFRGNCHADADPLLDCIVDRCRAYEERDAQNPCNENLHCPVDHVCNFYTAICAEEYLDDFGIECETDISCAGGSYVNCVSFQGSPNAHCSRPCNNDIPCTGNADVCLIGPESIDNDLPGYCGLPEWGNYYGIPCVEEVGCVLLDGNTLDGYECRTFAVLNDDDTSSTYSFCSTACYGFDCPEGWECCTASGDNNFCAPATICGFSRPCEDDQGCLSLSSYPVCQDGECTKGCTETNECPPGAACIGFFCGEPVE